MRGEYDAGVVSVVSPVIDIDMKVAGAIGDVHRADDAREAIGVAQVEHVVAAAALAVDVQRPGGRQDVDGVAAPVDVHKVNAEGEGYRRRAEALHAGAG